MQFRLSDRSAGQAARIEHAEAVGACVAGPLQKRDALLIAVESFRRDRVLAEHRVRLRDRFHAKAPEIPSPLFGPMHHFARDPIIQREPGPNVEIHVERWLEQSVSGDPRAVEPESDVGVSGLRFVQRPDDIAGFHVGRARPARAGCASRKFNQQQKVRAAVIGTRRKSGHDKSPHGGSRTALSRDFIERDEAGDCLRESLS